MPRHLRVLAIFLGPDLIGHLGHFEGRNVFAATPDYVANPLRRTLSLAFHDPSEEVTRRLLTHRSDRISSNLRLPPFFSNLLPEGALRARIAAELKVSEEQEFDLLAALGGDLPGAVTASVAERAPSTITDYFRLSSTVDVSTRVGRAVERFSLSGVQLKFSVLLDVRRRYTLARETESGSIIIKLPHPGRLLLPENEYSCMTLARLAGVDTPEFWIDDISALDIEGLTGFVGQFFAIRRFDRTPDRVHIEDFAQVLSLRAEQKYGHTNYDTLANILLNRTGAGVDNLRRFIRRLVVNLLIGNGDAHVKNFSLIYPDGRTPELAPAYDIVSTIQYLPSDTRMGLNLRGDDEATSITLDHFDRLARRLQLPAPGLLTREVRETVGRAHGLWPSALGELPMAESHKAVILDRLKTLPIARV